MVKTVQCQIHGFVLLEDWYGAVRFSLIGYTQCSTDKVSYCTFQPPPTIPSIVTFHFTRPVYWDIKPLHSGDSISPALQVVLGLVIGSAVCCPLIIVAVLTCCACIEDFCTKRQQNLDQRQLRKQAKLGVPTSSNEKPSLSTISSALEALPPPYEGVSDKHHVEAAHHHTILHLFIYNLRIQ
ncbi:unnamed protein product [Adineta ricciae]|uniref:Uncharacterized protein n=1 Tax=Adineta ricciae TaxID=249248 RepID=A0A815D4W3_ADIRI|nr:unnamed protein product [Adineta ricciae]